MKLDTPQAKADGGKSIEVSLSKIKETKGTVVYGTDAEDAAVSTLYIRKEHLPEPFPKKVSLLIAI